MNIPRFLKIPTKLCVLSTGLQAYSKHTVLCVASILKCFYICVFPHYNKLIHECIVHHTHKALYKVDLLLHICIFCCSSFCSHNEQADIRCWYGCPPWLHMPFFTESPAQICGVRKDRSWNCFLSTHVSSLISGPHHVLFKSVLSGWKSF